MDSTLATSQRKTSTQLRLLQLLTLDEHCRGTGCQRCPGVSKKVPIPLSKYSISFKVISSRKIFILILSCIHTTWHAFKMSRNARNRIFCHVLSTKIYISLRIYAVWSVFVFRTKKRRIFDCLKCAQWIFWSGCANLQANLNLSWMHMSVSTFPELTAHLFVLKNSLLCAFKLGHTKGYKMSQRTTKPTIRPVWPTKTLWVFVGHTGLIVGFVMRCLYEYLLVTQVLL